MEGLPTTQDLHENTEFSVTQDHLLDAETALPIHDHIKGRWLIILSHCSLYYYLT